MGTYFLVPSLQSLGLRTPMHPRHGRYAEPLLDLSAQVFAYWRAMPAGRLLRLPHGNKIQQWAEGDI